MIFRKLFKSLVKVAIFLAVIILSTSFVIHTCGDGCGSVDTSVVNAGSPGIKLPDHPISHYIENMLTNYNKVSKAKIGTGVKCPVCGRSYTKVETDGFECCSRVCERAYRDMRDTYDDYKDGTVTFNEIKELVEDYFKRLKIRHDDN